ncbi:hypothetical protein FDP41_013431 [Naegleria fowleri]|uniref:Dynamin GTPase domain-containing protein n=1 Tax=Naegleria fowleri TaxID=5763 RepID=A0A6A5BSR3_NAEFO|nr:uncharacterized protein FDP41_013431 [Naegleria fowleri]KAF0980217.1 hypothetical protein FDP41_013431 [Naegleria fowleri]
MLQAQQPLPSPSLHGDESQQYKDLLQSQSKKYREINDQLSSVLSQYEDLRPPNIVVIGEQSAGKSSVLEYLSGIRFVTGAAQLEKAIDDLTKLHLQFEGNNSCISNQLIEVEVTSPHVPDLTLIDLHGFIATSGVDNPTLKDDIRQLVKQNLTDRDCILIVGEAGRDLQTIVGFEEAREKDPSQKRTLCAFQRDLKEEGP